MGLKGDVPIQDAADALFKGDPSQVKKGLRNLNQRDGYTITFHADKTLNGKHNGCLLYTSTSPRDTSGTRKAAFA